MSQRSMVLVPLHLGDSFPVSPCQSWQWKTEQCSLAETFCILLRGEPRSASHILVTVGDVVWYIFPSICFRSLFEVLWHVHMPVGLLIPCKFCAVMQSPSHIVLPSSCTLLGSHFIPSFTSGCPPATVGSAVVSQDDFSLFGDAEPLFKCLLANYMSPLGKYLFKFFANVLIGLFALLCLSFMHSLLSLDIIT